MSSGKGFSSYGARNEVLKDLGFEDYAMYLRSPLWAKVRTNVFEQRGRDCYCCGLMAIEVHHERYALEDLEGRCLDFLHPICDRCHRFIERDENGEKVGHDEANRTMRCLRFVANNFLETKPGTTVTERLVASMMTEESRMRSSLDVLLEYQSSVIRRGEMTPQRLESFQDEIRTLGERARQIDKHIAYADLQAERTPSPFADNRF